MDTAIIRSGRAELAAFASADGSPVVFLHAGVADSRMWDLAGLRAGFRAIAYDRRGYGRTTCEAEEHSGMADLLAVVDAVGGGAPAVLVGSSWGGRLAIDLALTHPARVRGLVLGAPAVSGAPPPVFPQAIAALQSQLEDAEDEEALDVANDIEAHLWLDGPLQEEGRVGGAARRLFLDMNGAALHAAPVGRDTDDVGAYARLGGITQPTTIIWGDLDFPHVTERCRYMRSTIPGATGTMIPGVAHLPSLERPQEVTDLINAFLSRL